MKIENNKLIEVENKDIKNGTFIIPKHIKRIDDKAFFDCKLLEKIIIPNNVTSIGECAFYGCLCLEKVIIPDSVTTIEDGAFNGCISLKNIILPNSVKSIYKRAFAHCKSLESITIPDGVTIIEDRTFEYCESLKEIKIPESVKTIGIEAFANCESLENVTIPKNIISIKSEAFARCKFLKEIIIPESIETIGTGVFCGCLSLKKVILPNSLTKIGHRFFDSCISLKNITIPNSVIQIDDFAFSDCQSLKEIKISNSVKTIGKEAFAYCKHLEEISIPSSVVNMGREIFYYCESLKNVEMSDSITNIKFGLFSHCQSLEKVNIPNSITSIETSMFGGCKSLKSIIIPKNIKSIDEYSFSGCESLEDITFLSSLYLNQIDLHKIFYSNKKEIEEITIYNQRVLFNDVHKKLPEIQSNELLDIIKNELIKNGITYKKYYQYKQHKKIIDEIIKKLDCEEDYDYKKDLDDYIKEYIENNKQQIITYKPMDIILSELENYNNNVDIEIYSAYIAGMYYNITSYYSKNTEKLKVRKNLEKLSKQNLIEKIINKDSNNGLYVNEEILQKLIEFANNEQIKIQEETDNLVLLKKVIELYLKLLEKEKKNIEDSLISVEDKAQIISNTNKVNNMEKIIYVMINYINTISNHIIINENYKVKIKEVTSVQIPSILLNISNNYIQNSKENLEILNSFSNYLKEIINRNNEINIDITDEKTLKLF